MPNPLSLALLAVPTAICWWAWQTILLFSWLFLHLVEGGLEGVQRSEGRLKRV